MLKTLFIKNNKKREAALKNEAGGDEKHPFFLLSLMKIIWLIFSAVSWAEMKNLQRLEQDHFLVSQLRRSISRVLYAPTFIRIDFKPEGNLQVIILFEQHAPPAFAFFWLHLNWAN